jgi:hypothetical protein
MDEVGSSAMSSMKEASSPQDLSSSQQARASVEPLFQVKASWSQAGIGTCFVLESTKGRLRMALDLGWCVALYIYFPFCTCLNNGF